jgi:hypothetical protein
VKSVIRTEKCSKLTPSFFSLLMSFWCEMDSVVRHGLVDISILVALGLSMSYEDDQLERDKVRSEPCYIGDTT